MSATIENQAPVQEATPETVTLSLTVKVLHDGHPKAQAAARMAVSLLERTFADALPSMITHAIGSCAAANRGDYGLTCDVQLRNDAQPATPEEAAEMRAAREAARAMAEREEAGGAGHLN